VWLDTDTAMLQMQVLCANRDPDEIDCIAARLNACGLQWFSMRLCCMQLTALSHCVFWLELNLHFKNGDETFWRMNNMICLPHIC
jgi:hypothetical protein